MIKLLIADDEDFVRYGLIRNIQWDNLGIDMPEEADDGISALNKIHTFNPDIILTDIRMPRMDGIELASKVKGLLPDCKIIFMSAYSDKEYYKSAINMKAISYVEKPIVIKEITDALTSAIELYHEEEKKRKLDLKKEKQFLESLQIFKGNIALELIKPDVDRESIGKRLKTTEIDFPIDSRFAVAILKSGNQNPSIFNNDPTSTNCHSSVLEQIFSSNNLNYLSSVKDNSSLIIVFHEKQLDNLPLTSSHVEKACKDLLAYYSGKHEIFISIGKLVNGIENIKESYKSAEISCQQLFFSGYGNLTRHTFATDAYNLGEESLNAFVEYLENKEKLPSIQFIRDLSNQIRLHPSTPVKYIKNIYFRLLLQLIKSANKRGVAISMDNAWETISGHDTLSSIENYLVENVSLYFKHLEERYPNNATINDIIRIISELYQSTDLSIKTIADRLFLSHTYLCVVFKKETGKTINQYLTEFRVDKAKELLKEQNIKLYDVAVRVGYTDHNYFTKIFKKITNMTPTEYKEKYIK